MRGVLLAQQQGDESPQQRGRKECEQRVAAAKAGFRDAATSLR